MVIALPPANAHKIRFEPSLSTERNILHTKTSFGASAKALYYYDRPYWRERGYSGEILSDCHDGPVFNAYDDSRMNENG